MSYNDRYACNSLDSIPNHSACCQKIGQHMLNPPKFLQNIIHSPASNYLPLFSLYHKFTAAEIIVYLLPICFPAICFHPDRWSVHHLDTKAAKSFIPQSMDHKKGTKGLLEVIAFFLPVVIIKTKVGIFFPTL